MLNIDNNADPRRQLPSVDVVIQQATSLVEQWGHTQTSKAVRTELARIRADIAAGGHSEVIVADVIRSVEAHLIRINDSTIRQVFNLTGIVLHSNLGRAMLPQKALDAVILAASAPINLEFEIEKGMRGDRDSHIEPLICELTGAEAATVVNNNAAAVLLVLNTLAAGGQVPVSRGELVEIGGSFRIPEVMERSGCKLVEIGATNRTHIEDYEKSISEKTALLMKVHTSNFRIEGFTKQVTEVELAKLAHMHHLPLMADLGSGNLINLAEIGLPAEPTAAEAIANGVDIICFSGDKLLGGPQCGIIAGRRELLDRIRTNPLKRALRVDKMTLAALAEVLKMYRDPARLRSELPTLNFLSRSLVEIEEQARRLLPAMAAVLPAEYEVSVRACSSQIGSGALPIETIPSYALVVTASKDAQLRGLVNFLGQLPRPVIGRLNDQKLWLDLRCLDCEQQFAGQLAELGELLE
jgi:L-seryl-tRNA(Ser) seleniumtransferase